MKFFDDVINSVVICFIKYFDFEGRASRAEFWHWQISHGNLMIMRWRIYYSMIMIGENGHQENNNG